MFAINIYDRAWTRTSSQFLNFELANAHAQSGILLLLCMREKPQFLVEREKHSGPNLSEMDRWNTLQWRNSLNWQLPILQLWNGLMELSPVEENEAFHGFLLWKIAQLSLNWQLPILQLWNGQMETHPVVDQLLKLAASHTSEEDVAYYVSHLVLLEEGAKWPQTP